MKKSLLILTIIVLSIFALMGCEKKNKDAILFKEDYESLNKTTNASGKEHRTVNIASDNPFIITDAKDIVDKIENKETFYVYFGSKLCPWCRSVIEKAIEVADDYDVSKIYYVDIWDDEGNEILRDKYKINDDNEIELVTKADSSYSKLLEYFDSLLEEYTLTDNEGNKISVGEKRIYAPNYIYVEDGVAKKITTGISDKQTDSREELTEEILNDEQELFETFFAEMCDESC